MFGPTHLWHQIIYNKVIRLEIFLFLTPSTLINLIIIKIKNKIKTKIKIKYLSCYKRLRQNLQAVCI